MTSLPMIDRRTAPARTPSPSSARRAGSVLLWVVLVVGVLAHITSSAVLTTPYLGGASGVLVLACVATLAVRARTGTGTSREGA
jgi:hypothetical protein